MTSTLHDVPDFYYNDVTWVSWLSKPLASRLFVKKLVQANTMEHQNSASLVLCGWREGDPPAIRLPLKWSVTCWRHQMETFSAILSLCAGNSPVPVNSPHKGQWRGALMFSLICAWINDLVNNREAGDLRRHRGHYDVIVMNEENVPMTWCHHVHAIHGASLPSHKSLYY